MKKHKIVTIGGGSGQYNLLTGLRDIKSIDITSVVSMADSGGSSGRLRDEFGILPPGDIVKCILALSPYKEARKILLTRFKQDNRLNNHYAGNLLVTMLNQYLGDFAEGIQAFGELLGIKGRVFPVTTDRATLVAELSNGEYLYGETVIDIPRGNQREKIKKTFLVPHHADTVTAYPPVLEAIKEADYVVVGPGDLHSSIIPNLLVPGITAELKKTRGKMIFIVNVMTKFGETDKFSVNDFVREIEDRIGRRLDYILVNDGQVEKKTIKRYKEQKAELVKINKKLKEGGRRYIIDNYLSDIGDVVRHDAGKLAIAIEKIIKK